MKTIDDLDKNKLNKVEQAILFATRKHLDQIRKSLPWPYIVHIYDVANILRENNADENSLVAGILHDTVEDTDTTLEEISNKFGYEVAHLVDILSEDKELEYNERKEIQAQRISLAPKKAKLIKCADCLSNLKSLLLEIKSGKNDIWNSFNSSKENIKAHYCKTLQAIYKDLSDTKALKDLICVYEEVFKEKFDISTKKTTKKTAKTQTKPIIQENKQTTSNSKGMIKKKNKPCAYVSGKKITDCTECFFMKRIITPDPNDWFNDDDEEYVCKKANRTISEMNRPYEKQPIPDFCPFLEK